MADYDFSDFIREKNRACSDDVLEESYVGLMSVCPAKCGRTAGCTAFTLEGVTFGHKPAHKCKLYASCDQATEKLDTDVYRMKQFR